MKHLDCSRSGDGLSRPDFGYKGSPQAGKTEEGSPDPVPFPNPKPTEKKNMNERANLVIEGPDSLLKEQVIQYYRRTLGWKVVHVKDKVSKARSSYEDVYRNEINSILVSTHISSSAESLFWFGRQPFEFDEKKAYDHALQENACVILVIPDEKEFVPTEWKYASNPSAETRRYFLIFWTEMSHIPFHSIQTNHPDTWDKIMVKEKKLVCDDREVVRILT